MIKNNPLELADWLVSYARDQIHEGRPELRLCNAAMTIRDLVKQVEQLNKDLAKEGEKKVMWRRRCDVLSLEVAELKAKGKDLG